ncbi:MAG: antitoxin [Lysobacterales bacterium]
MTATAKLFTLGKSQAVRIPARFRLQADEVEITERDGALILRPKQRSATELLARARASAGDAFEDWERPAQGELEPICHW